MTGLEVIALGFLKGMAIEGGKEVVRSLNSSSTNTYNSTYNYNSTNSTYNYNSTSKSNKNEEVEEIVMAMNMFFYSLFPKREDFIQFGINLSLEMNLGITRVVLDETFDMLKNLNLPKKIKKKVKKKKVLYYASLLEDVFDDHFDYLTKKEILEDFYKVIFKTIKRRYVLYIPSHYKAILKELPSYSYLKLDHNLYEKCKKMF